MTDRSDNSKKSKHKLDYDDGMIGGLSVDAHRSNGNGPNSNGPNSNGPNSNGPNGNGPNGNGPSGNGPQRRRTVGNGSGSEDMTVGDLMTGMPNIRLTALLSGFLKQIVWVLPLFILGSVVLHFITKDIKRDYTGEGRLLVQIGPEYIYTPIGANTNNNAGVSQTPDTIALNEVGIMKNSELINQVIGIMTSPRDGLTERQAQDLFDKQGYKKIRAAESRGSKREIEDAYAAVHKKVFSSYQVAPRPRSSIIDVSYVHENPEIAVETVNQFIDAYKAYRRSVFVEGSEDTITERRDETERQLKENESLISAFLRRHNISDFDSEQMGLWERSEDLKADLNTLRGDIAETETALATVEDQLRTTNQTINLYVDDRASQRISQTELELQQLLAKYLPTSSPVRQKRLELDELRALQRANNGQAAGGRRVGPNPVYQALLTRRNTLKSTADSFREKEFTLQKQLNSAVSKVKTITKITPEYQKLLRERQTLSAALDTYNARAQEALVNLSQVETNNENIKVISYASFAVKGTNTGKLIWAGGSFAWLMTLIMIALLAVFVNPKNFKTPDSDNGKRRRRATDVGGGPNIPDPIKPYDPSQAMPATDGQVSYPEPSPHVKQAIRNYNTKPHQNNSQFQNQSQNKGAFSPPNSALQNQPGSPAISRNGSYKPQAQQNKPVAQETTTLAVMNMPATNSAMAQNLTPEQLKQLDMQNNPYLKSKTHKKPDAKQKNPMQGLPILGSF